MPPRHAARLRKAKSGTAPAPRIKLVPGDFSTMAVTAMTTCSSAFTAGLAAALALSCSVAMAQPRSPAGDLARIGVADSAWPAQAPPRRAGSAPGASTEVARMLVRRAVPAAPSSCMTPWLHCSAFGTLETRVLEQNAFLNGGRARDDAMYSRSKVVHALTAGMRFEFPHTRTAEHGPWFLQLKISRRSSELKIPGSRQRRAAASLTIGTEF